jgi:YD repeat-containing protein
MSVKVVNAGTPLTGFDLWPVAGNGPRVRTLYHNSIPWERFTPYKFTLEFHPGLFTITVSQGATVLDSFTIADSTYTSGKFGFYNFSQAQVRYSGFRRTVLTQGTYTYDVDAIDPDSDPIIYSLTTFPGLMSIDPATGKITWPVTTEEVGSHGVTVQATDALGASDTQTFSIGVSLQNSAPTAEAGANAVVSLNRSVQLRGVVSDDGLPLAGNLTTSWSKVSGPGAVTFTNSSSPATTATFSEVGTYVLRLSASDSELNASDDVTVTVALANDSPVVNAGPDQIIGLPQTSVTLNGTATDDGLPENSTLTVSWSKVSGPGTVTFSPPNAASTTATFSELGAYVLRLSASDGEASTTDDVQVVLQPQNQAPIVNAGPDLTVNLPNSASLQGSASDDGLPFNELTIQWIKVTGPGDVTFASATQAATTASFSATGLYVLRLTSNDGGLTASDDVQVTYIDPTIPPPTLSFNNTLDGSEIKSPSPITGSVDGGSWIVEYALGGDDTLPQQWVTLASGTGPVTNGILATLDPTMLLNGIYAIRLSATNAGGQTTTATASVIVNGNMKVGNFTLAFSDLNVPVAGLPIQIIRTYDSRDKRKGDFGVGWHLGIQNVRLEKSLPIGRFWHQVLTPGIIPKYCIEETRKHFITITFGDGRVYKFQATLNPACRNVAPIDFTDVGYQPVAGLTGTSGATLVALGDNNTIVDGPSEGSVNLTTVSGLYNPRVFRLTTGEGMSFVIEQGVGLKSMTDLNGNTLTINSNGIIHSSGKSIVFNRDSQGRITQITDPAGQPMTYSYDTAGDLISFSDRETNTSTFSYNNTHGLLTIVDPRGIQPIRNDYDNDGRLISHTDAFGKTIQYTHLISARQERITDRLDNATLYEYDNNGNVLRMTDALGDITTYTYDSRDNKASETNALGKTTTYTYDTSDNLLTETDPLNNVTRYTYNQRRQVLTMTDPKNGITTNTYDGFGNVTSTRDALGNTTTYTYNSQGMMLTMTDALTRVTRYENNLLGYLTKETDARNHETTYTYDSNGNRLTQTTTRTLPGGTTETLTMTVEYDKLNRLTKTTYPDLTTTRVVYNSIGRQSAMFDQLGRETTYEYDSMGRLTKTTYPDTKFEESTYDAEGRRLTSKDRAGRITRFDYDALGRLTSTTYVDNSSMITVYDSIGRVESTRDARGNVTGYEYDPNCGCSGRRTKVIDAQGNETQFTYDANGNQATMKDARSNQMSFEYDALNRRTKTIYADTTFDETVYDSLGRNTSRRDQAGKVTQYGYDELGRLKTVTDALNQVTSYTYDELGNQITQTDALNRTTRYEYDRLGRRMKRTLPLGQVETYSYNAAGNLLTRTDFNGKATTYGYDTMNRMLSKTPHSSFAQAPVTYTFTATGQRATMADASGVTVYGYDVRDRMIGKQTPQGTLTYSYDSGGNVVTMRSLNTNGASVDYGYDTLNRLVSTGMKK